MNIGVGDMGRTLMNSALKGSTGSREQKKAGYLGSISGALRDQWDM